MTKKEGKPKTLEEIKKERDALKAEQPAILGDIAKSDSIIEEQEEKKRKAEAKIKELEDKKSGKKSTPDSDSEDTTIEAGETKEIKTAGEEIITKLEQDIEKARASLGNLIPGWPQDKEAMEADLDYLSSKLEAAKEILADRKEKEFLYYALENSGNKLLINGYKDTETGLTDLTTTESTTEVLLKRLYTTGDNASFVEHNCYGFIKIIKNVDEISDKDGMDIRSAKAIYKIVGPNGEVIADDVQGYDKATEIYSEKSREKEIVVIEEFKKLNPEDKIVVGLEDFKNKTTEQIKKMIDYCEEKKAIREKLPTFEKVMALMEAGRALELEKQPLQFKNKIISGLTKWENYGEGEEGIQGNKHRMIKAAVNMALIGIGSMASMDLLAKYGAVAATSVGSSVASRLGLRLGIGMGIGGTVDVGSKHIKSERMKKLMPWIMGGVSIIAATALSGTIAAGVVAGGSAYLGYQVSKRIKGIFTDKSIEEKREKAKEKLFNKYKVESGTLDLTRITGFEEDYRNLLIKFENKTITYKLLKEGTKLLAGTAVSVGAMSASGFAKDHFGNSETTNHSQALSIEEKHVDPNQHNLSPEQQHAEAIKNLDHMKADHAESVKHLEQIKTEHENFVKTESVMAEHKPLSVEFNAKGGIQTILDMKAQIHGQYPDISKAPAELQEFMKTNSTEEAIKLGFYDPNNPGGAESMTVQHGSTLTFDEKGLSMHDIKTGENHTLIETKGGAEIIEKYHGKMFDSDHSTTKIENTPHYNPNEAPQQIDAETGQPIGTEHQVDVVNGQSIDTTQYDPNNPNFDHQYDAPQQVDAETGKPMGGENNVNLHTGDNNSQINPTQENPSVMSNLTPEIQAQIHTAYNENIHHLFPNDKLMSEWDHMKDSASADRMVELGESNNLKPELQPLADHIQRLIEITGLHPHGVSIANPDPETVDHFMTRATTEAQVTGKIDDIRLSGDVHTADTSHSNNQSNEASSGKQSTENSMLANNEGKHIGTIELKENGSNLNMKFNYDPSGKVAGYNISGRYIGEGKIFDHYNLDSVPGEERAMAISGLKQLEMSNELLSKIPQGTPEYNYMYDNVSQIQENIVHQFGNNVIKPEDLLKSNNN